MIKQRFLLNQSDHVSTAPLEEMFEQLSSINEENGGFYEFSKDILRDKIADEEKMEMVINAIACGQAWARKMLTKFELERNVPQKPTNLARLLGLKINEISGKPTQFRMVFAQFVSDQTIEIVKEPIDQYTKLAEISLKLPHPDIVREVLIAHEIFHFLEMQYPEEMYSHQKTIRLWKLFNYEHRSTIGATSEIAAMAFAKEICSVDFVPQILDVLLSYPMEIEFSKNIYQMMMDSVKNMDRGETDD